MTTSAAAKKKPGSKLAAAARAVVKAVVRPSAILLVQDDPDLQWRLARTLTVHGHRVVGTSSSDGAMALMSQWQVDMVVIDADLPGSSALDLAKRIRANHSGIAIALAGDGGHEHHLAARLSGAFASLIKPLRVEAISELLSALPGRTVALPAE